MYVHIRLLIFNNLLFSFVLPRAGTASNQPWLVGRIGTGCCEAFLSWWTRYQHATQKHATIAMNWLQCACHPSRLSVGRWRSRDRPSLLIITAAVAEVVGHQSFGGEAGFCHLKVNKGLITMVHTFSNSFPVDYWHSVRTTCSCFSEWLVNLHAFNPNFWISLNHHQSLKQWLLRLSLPQAVPSFPLREGRRFSGARPGAFHRAPVRRLQGVLLGSCGAGRFSIPNIASSSSRWLIMI